MDYLADLFAKHRRLLGSFMIVLTVVALIGMSRLKVDSNPRAMLNARDLQAGPLRQLEEEFGSSDADCVIVLQADDFITPAGVRVVSALVARAKQLEGVRQVTSMLSVRGTRRVGRYVMPLIPSSPDASLARFEMARASAKDHALLGGLLSKDRSTTLVIVRLPGSDLSEAAVRRFVTELDEMIHNVTDGSSVSAEMTGMPVLRVEMISSLMRGQLKFNLTAMCASGGICFLIFRSVYSTLIVMLASLTGVFWAMGAMGWAGVPINMITSVIAPLVLVIGVSDAIHLHFETRKAKAAGCTRLQAAQAGIRNVGLACALTSITTCVGFGSLRLASLDVIRTFGTWAALGCALNFVAVIIVLPLLATVFPERAMARDVRLVGNAMSRLTPLLKAITRRRSTVVLVSLIATVSLFLLGTTLEAENKLTETISPTERSYQALQTCDEQFGGALMASVLLEWPEQQAGELIPVLEEVHKAIDRQPDIHHPTSLLSLFESLPRPFPHDPRWWAGQLNRLPADVAHRYINKTRNRAVVRARIPDAGLKKLSPEVDALTQELAEIASRHPGFRIELTGGSILSFRNLRLIVLDLWRSLSAAAIVIIIVLAFVFRSIGLGAISVVPNLFPLVCAAAVLVLLGRPLEVSSVVVFSMCLGIATDDTIHFLARYQRERSGGATPRQAVDRAIEVVGEAIVVTTILLTFGFGSFMFSEIPALQNVGQLACVALVSALVGDLAILPSLILLVYDRGVTEASAAESGSERP